VRPFERGRDVRLARPSLVGFGQPLPCPVDRKLMHDGEDNAAAGRLLRDRAPSAGTLPGASRRRQGEHVSLIPILVILFAAMWLLVIRPQRQRQRDTKRQMDSLIPGAEVITAGGLYGTVRAVEDEELQIEIADDVVVRVARRAIAAVVEPDELDPEGEALAELERAQLEAETQAVAGRDSGER
jgi:preprotein translocase subunit YajC